MLTRRDEIDSSASEQPCGNGSGLRRKTGSNLDLPLILCVLGQGPHYYLLVSGQVVRLALPVPTLWHLKVLMLRVFFVSPSPGAGV